MRVLIIDSSIQILDRLEEILSESSLITAIYKSVSYRHAIILIKENKPDLVLLDIYLPGNGSINLFREIKKAGCKTVFIILSMQEDIYMLEQYKSPEADFFFDKYNDFEKIPAIINSIADIITENKPNKIIKKNQPLDA